MRRWIGLALFLGIGMMKCVFGLDCIGFGVEIWILWMVQVELWTIVAGNRPIRSEVSQKWGVRWNFVVFGLEIED